MSSQPPSEMAKPPAPIGRFVSPLTDTEHAIIGRISVLWGQIEYQIDAILALLLNLDWDQVSLLNIDDRPVGAKLQFIRAGLRGADEHLNAEIEAFCSAVQQSKQVRNDVMHGVWGLRAKPRKKVVEACLRRTGQPNARFWASQLPKLERDLCVCSSMGLEIESVLHGIAPPADFERFVFHGETDPPLWLAQWLERNPPGHDNPNYISKAGQLPRPAAPYSQK